LKWSRSPLQVAVGASLPDLRPEASVTVVGKHLVMFGGLDYGKFMMNSSVLDLDQRCWVPTEVDGELPGGRINHCGKVLVFAYVCFFCWYSLSVFGFVFLTSFFLSFLTSLSLSLSL
jgi:hypothetical protein